MSEEILAAKYAYDAAKRRLAECKPNDRMAEQNFMLTYRRLAMLGVANPIKRKYRG